MTTSTLDAAGTNPNGDERALVELFPEGTFVDAEGELTVGGIRLTDIAERFGTPAYVLDEAGLIRQATLFREALAARWPNSRVVFASKAFPATAVYRTLAAAGLGADVAGGGELVLALAAGVEPDSIVMHGNAKSVGELQAAVDAGVGLVVIDNFDDITKLEEIVTGRQDVLIRVLPDVAAQTHEALETGKQGSKFGLERAEAERAITRLRSSEHLNLRGLHMHIGSQICEVEPYVAAVKALASYGEFDIYDLGGGLGVRYTYDDAPPGVEAWLDGLIGAASEYLPSHAQLLIEPGRSVVARSGLTLYRVVSVKEGHPTFVAVDGGMGDNLEVSLYGQRFEATVVNRVGGGGVVNLVGKHCESGDRISTGVALREPEVGDVVAVPVTGAYCHTMSNNYNGARRPPVIFVSGGKSRAVVRRETYEDLMRRDLVDLSEGA